jgi:hypothetical protein
VLLEGEGGPLGRITSAATLPDGSFVVATASPAVYRFSQSGQRITKIGRSGPGPFEYQSPSIVRTDGERIAVWDSDALKLITYGPDGKALNEWSTMVSQAVSDLVLSGDSLFAYHSGGLRRGYVRGYSLKQEEPLFRIGKAPIEHAVLMMLAGSGALSLSPDTLYFASAAEPVVHSFSLDTRAAGELAVADPSFEVGDAGFASISEIGANRKEAIKFISTNSRFYELNTFRTSILAVLEHGTVSYGSKQLRAHDRHLHVHHLSKRGSSLACERIELDFTEGEVGTDPIVGRSDRGFLVVQTREASDDRDFGYVLTEWRVPVK